MNPSSARHARVTPGGAHADRGTTKISMAATLGRLLFLVLAFMHAVVGNGCRTIAGAALGAGAATAAPTFLGAGLGITAAGPVAGGAFAGMQAAAAGGVAGGGLAAGGGASLVQGIVMGGVGWPVVVGGALVGVILARL